MSATFVPFDPTRPVAVVGAGVMGTKVAWACARAGLRTRLFDVESGKASASKRRALDWSDGDERERVDENLTVTDTLAEALSGAQLGFENVPERLELKQEVHRRMSSLLDEAAYLGSNTSSLTCTPLALESGRPERYFNLNFTDPRYDRLVELMTSERTADETIAFAKSWARAIGMIPIWTRKEQLGYSFNRLWRVIKKETLRQIAEGYATPEDIDRTWMLGFGMSQGPCGLMDDIGLHSVLSIEKVYHQASGDPSDQPPEFLSEMVARGDLGVVSGQGFYSYPDPAYRQPGFLESTDD